MIMMIMMLMDDDDDHHHHHHHDDGRYNATDPGPKYNGNDDNPKIWPKTAPKPLKQASKTAQNQKTNWTFDFGPSLEEALKKEDAPNGPKRA